MDNTEIHYLGKGEFGIYPLLLKAVSEDKYLEVISGLTSEQVHRHDFCSLVVECTQQEWRILLKRATRVYEWWDSDFRLSFQICRSMHSRSVPERVRDAPEMGTFGHSGCDDQQRRGVVPV